MVGREDQQLPTPCVSRSEIKLAPGIAAIAGFHEYPERRPSERVLIALTAGKQGSPVANLVSTEELQ